MTRYLPLIFTGVLLNAVAQLALKQGMRQIGHFDFTPATLFAMSWRIGTNGYVVLGLACYVVSVAVWLLALSRVEVSFAYPMLSVEPTMSSWDAWVAALLAARGVEVRWTQGATFGLSAGGDVLHDQRTTLMTLESVAREYLDGLVWRPLEPVQRVPWFVTYRERSLRDSPATEAAVRVITRLARDQGWTAELTPPRSLR